VNVAYARKPPRAIYPSLGCLKAYALTKEPGREGMAKRQEQRRVNDGLVKQVVLPFRAR